MHSVTKHVTSSVFCCLTQKLTDLIGENGIFLIDRVLCNYCSMRIVASFFPTYHLAQFLTIFFLTSTTNVKGYSIMK